MTTQNLWDAAKAVLRGSLSNTNPTSREKKKKTSNRQPNVTPKPIGKGRTTTTKPKLVEGKKS